MFHSFRLKIALLSGCLSGAVLLAFGLAFLSIIKHVGHHRIESELLAMADAQIRIPHPPPHWSLFDNSLQTFYENQTGKQFMMQVRDNQGQVLYTSSNWVDGLTADLPPVSNAPSGPVALGMGGPFEPFPGSNAPPHRMPNMALPNGLPPPFSFGQIRGPLFTTLQTPSDQWRGVTLGNQWIVLTLGMNLSGLTAEIRHFRTALAIAMPLAFLFLLAGGWMLAQLTLRPINVIARTTESTHANSLDRRIPDTHADREFQRLIRIINNMLERLDRSFEQAVRFSADAAHELKTPLTILQAQLERNIQQAERNSPEQRAYAELLEEVQRLKSIVRNLLLLSQADSGRLAIHRTPLDFTAMIRDLCDDLALWAPDRKVVAPVWIPVTIQGDADLLRQALTNLFTNAVKFSRPDSAIYVDIRVDPNHVIFRISNEGHPIPAEARDRVFERFYRVDQAHSRQIEGVGLGLSLAREIARAHQGDLVLAQSNAEITTFELTLPLGTLFENPIRKNTD